MTMNSKMPQHAQEFSLLRETDQSARPEAIIAIGKKLVAELQLGDSVDTLGRWMAHHIAELIYEAENIVGDARPSKHAQLRDAILALWAHRYELPSRARPFSEMEPVFRALASLDPESKTARYLSSSRLPESERNESEETRKWIELAKGIDYVSKILIDDCLISAADSAIDKSKEWVNLAHNAGVDCSFEFPVIQFISSQRDVIDVQDEDENIRRILADREKKLEAFLSMASLLSKDIKTKLDRLSGLNM